MPDSGGVSFVREYSKAGLRDALLALLAGLIAFWTRMTRFSEIFVGDTALPLGADSAYHLHRMRWFAEGNERILFDSWLNWPEGTISLWAPGFDTLGALWAELFSFLPTEAALVYLPPALAFVSAGVIVLAARRLVPDRPEVAFIAGVFFAVMPQAIEIGRLGRNDHHVAEALGVGLLILWGTKKDTYEDAFVTRVAYELGGAVLMCGFVWVFSGAIVFVGGASFALLIRRWSAGVGRAQPILGSGFLGLILAGCLLLGVFGALVREHGHVLDYRYPSLLHGSLLVLAGIGAWCALRIQLHGWHGSTCVYPRDLVVTLSAGVLGLVLAVLILGEFFRGAREFLGTQDAYLASISEMQPLLLGPLWQLGSWSTAYDMWGAFAYIILPSFLVLLLSKRLKVDGAYLFFVLFATILVALAFNQNRFGRGAVGGIALVSAIAISELTARLSAHRGVLAMILGGAIIAEPRLSSRLMPPLRPISSLAEVSLMIRRPLSPLVKGQKSGVLARWDEGFEVLYIARRPILSSGFGPFTYDKAYALEQAAWRGSIEDFEALVLQRDLGFVISGVRSFLKLRGPQGEKVLVGDGSGRGLLSRTYRERFPMSALAVGGSGYAEANFRHIPFLKPVAVSSKVIERTHGDLPERFAFKVVLGAVVTGTVAPGQRVKAQSKFELGGREFDYFGWAEADSEGRFLLRWPIAGLLVLEGIRTATLGITEDMIHEGLNQRVVF